MCGIGLPPPHLLIVCYVGRREVEPKSVPIVVRVGSNLDVVLAFAHLGHLAYVTTGTTLNVAGGQQTYHNEVILMLK